MYVLAPQSAAHVDHEPTQSTFGGGSASARYVVTLARTELTLRLLDSNRSRSTIALSTITYCGLSSKRPQWSTLSVSARSDTLLVAVSPRYLSPHDEQLELPFSEVRNATCPGNSARSVCAISP